MAESLVAMGALSQPGLGVFLAFVVSHTSLTECHKVTLRVVA